MDATIVTHERSVERLPEDLRVWLGEQELSWMAWRAVELADMPEFYVDCAGHRNRNGKLMLALLSYCYAIHCCGSQEVQWAIESDRTTRDICGGTYLDWGSIRQFRIKNLERIEKALVHISTTAIAQRFLSADFDLRYATPNASVLAWARGKIEFANLLDAAASD